MKLLQLLSRHIDRHTISVVVLGAVIAAAAVLQEGLARVLTMAVGCSVVLVGGVCGLVLPQEEQTRWRDFARSQGWSWQQHQDLQLLEGSLKDLAFYMRVTPCCLHLTCPVEGDLERGFPDSARALDLHLDAISRGALPMASLRDPRVRKAWQRALDKDLNVFGSSGAITLTLPADSSPAQLQAALAELQRLYAVIRSSPHQRRLARKMARAA